MHAQRWTRWGMRTNNRWPTAGHSASRRRFSLKAVVSSTTTVNRQMDWAALPAGITQEEPRYDR